MSAFLIYSTITLSGFGAQQWTAIEYPSLPICEAQAASLKASLARPESVKDRAAKEITIKIAPRCTSQPPQFFIIDGAQQ
jgi:hypothetical protein